MIADCYPVELEPRPHYRHVRLIYNPNAGKLIKNPGLAVRVRAVLREAGMEAHLVPTAAPAHATALAADAVREGADLIIAMGGDGTVNEVLNGLAPGSRVPLAVIPGGTANVFCCETGISRNPLKAAQRLPEWVEARIALGRVEANGLAARHFLSMAGAGLDAGIVQRVEPGIKRRLGKLAYWIAGLRTFGSRLVILKARAEGREAVTGFALASRVRNYGGDLTIATKASLFEDRFELVTFAGGTTLPYGIYLGGAVIACTTKLPGVTSIFTQRVELAPATGDPVYLQIDGEAAGLLPATIDLVPDALTVLVPREAKR